jgi:Immunoglobulin-like domain of bacterial spore germination
MVNDFGRTGEAGAADAELEQQVRDALRHEADTVEPSGAGLGAIQARTAGGAAAARARTRWFAGGTAALATAAAVAAIAVIGTGDLGIGPGPRPGPAGPPADTQALQIFYLDRTPERIGEPGSESVDEPGLYREVHQVEVQAGPVEAAVRELASGTPRDADYVNAWAGTTVRSVEVRADRVVVEVDQAPVTGSPAPGQQLAHTVTAAAGHDVEVVVRAQGVDAAPLHAAPPLEAFARIWVSTPAQDATVDAPVRFTGMAATFEGNVAYEVLRGRQVVASGATITRGGMGVWSPWTFTERLAPGTYTLVAFDEDPALGGRRDVDTKVFTVR